MTHLRLSSIALLGLSVAMLSVSGTARAEYPSQAPYIGVFGGGSLQMKGWDLGRGTYKNGLRPDDGAGEVGLRLGVQVFAPLAVEGEFAYLPVKSTSGGSNKVYSYSVNAYYHLLSGDWTPFVGAGIGAYQVTGGDLGKDSDQRTHVALGLRGLLAPNIALRAEAREVITDGFGNGGGHNLELNGGLDFFLWSATPPVLDRDKDGVADAEDKCPDVVGPKENFGCPPDRDRDGVLDANDKCPDVPGVVALQGCPDTDGDGIADAEDKCPNAAGPIATQGCPDRDSDGILDSDDKCPDVAGVAAFQGCPDTDGDGLADPEDKCPKEAGPKETQGCPDRDKDTVIDKEDKCPDVPGVPERQGCLPEEVEKKFTGAIQGIYFDTGSARIQPRSFKVLDEAVALLKQYQGLRLRVEGHTDNVGKPDKNQKLSEDRAASVRDYLVSKGVDAGRFESKGYGDTKPAQPNTNDKNRASNRRIEFTPLGAK